MATIAIYVPEGREIDLGALRPADFEMIKGLQGQILKGDRVLLCKATAGDREMCVARSPNGLYFARHFPGGAHGGRNSHAIARMSDAHLRGTDTWLQAWQDAGVTTGTEVSTDNRVRLDAVAFGPQVTALETQVKNQSAAHVKGRHTQRRRAKAFTGKYAQALNSPLQVVWFAPVGRPDWLYSVPTIECHNQSWRVTPAPSTVDAIGVRSMDVKPCSPAWFSRCPDQPYGWCSKPHLWAQPRGGLSIADVAAMVTTGDLLPVQLPNGIYLTDRIGYARCKSFGYSAPQTPRQPPRSRLRDCGWAGHERTSRAAVPGEGFPLKTCLLCGDIHDRCQFSGLSVFCIKADCHNPHHRPIRHNFRDRTG